jgi:hypothetical protein
VSEQKEHAHEQYITNIPEGIFDHWCELMFSVEKVMRPDSPERQRIYRLRCEVGKVQMMNRTDKDKPQSRWEYEKLGE